MSLAVHHKILGSGYPIVAHLHFPFVQTFGDDGLYFGVREIFIVDLHQGHTLDLVLQTVDIGAELATSLAPKDGVLSFGIEEGAIEVEKCCFESFHLNNTLNEGTKLRKKVENEDLKRNLNRKSVPIRKDLARFINSVGQ